MTMASEFLLPDLGEGLTEAAIVAWLVAPGDMIAVDQPVVEVESAKSIVELPSPYAGRVESLHAAQGEVVRTGSALLTVLSEAEIAESGAVLVGYGTAESTKKPRRATGQRFGRAPAEASTRPLVGDASAVHPSAADPPRRSPVVSPLVRKQAREHGIDAAQLAGSGPDSLVLRSDVDRAIAALEDTLAPAVGPETSSSSSVDDVHIPITGMRKLIGARLSRSRSIIPEATIWLDVDATELFVARDRLRKSTGEKFGITALIARFVVAGLAEYPILNSSIDDTAGEIIQHSSIGLGIAAQTARGLMVPVIHNAGSLTTRGIRDAVEVLVARAGNGDYTPEELDGGTFTLNNYGSFGIDGSTPIINYPEVGMLGVGRIIDRPWVVEGELSVRKVVTLSFVFDHRVCDGDVASGFLTFVARCIEEPLTLLGSI
jgi:pyruvate dehydrogenase E2 component (dihydrolipoamide acetyltransferase)